MTNSVILYGGSGHAKVISSICNSLNILIAGVFDDKTDIILPQNFTHLGKYNIDSFAEYPIIVCIGDNKIRKNIVHLIVHEFICVIHPSAIIDKNSKISVGTVVMHNVVVQIDVNIGAHCIINTNSIVEHDCTLHDFVHLSPSATLCGNVHVGEGTHIGAGAVVIPNVKIGKWCVIGAGAVITEDIPDFSLVVGIPGKVIKKLL